MAITTAFPTSCKAELLTGTHIFGTGTSAHTFKMALIDGTHTGTYGAASTNYSQLTTASDEVTGTGYTAGGNNLTNNANGTAGTTAFVDFQDTSWTSATFSADGCEIYNTNAANAVVYVGDFGGAKSVTGGTFTVQFPTANATSAVLRLA